MKRFKISSFILVALALVLFTVFSPVKNVAYAATGDTSALNIESIKSYKFISGNVYRPIFTIQNSTTNQLEFAFCVEFDEDVVNSETYLNSQLVTSQDYPAMNGKVLAIQKFANTPGSLDTLKSITGNNNLTTYEMLYAAQISIWYFTDNINPVTTGNTTYVIPDFLNLVPTNNYTLQESNTFAITNYFINTLPAVTATNTPFAEIADITIEWNYDNSEFTIQYRVDGENANGTPLVPTTKYFDGTTESADLKSYETTVQKNGQTYYSLTLPASYATKNISIEASGEQIYTGYFATIINGIQDVGGYTENKKISFKDRESITITVPAIVYGQFTIQKNETGSNKPIAGAEFTLTHAESGKTYIVTTDANGTATFTELYLGNYSITESKVPAGYTAVAISPNTFELTKENATSLAKLTVENTLIPVDPEAPTDPEDVDTPKDPDDTDNPEEPKTPDNQTLPQTDGSFNHSAASGVALLLIAFTSMYLTRRKQIR